MKLTDINSNSVKEILDRELISMHRRTHQLYALAVMRKSNKEFIDLLVHCHYILEEEISRRGFKHKSPLTKGYISTQKLVDLYKL